MLHSADQSTGPAALHANQSKTMRSFSTDRHKYKRLIKHETRTEKVEKQSELLIGINSSLFSNFSVLGLLFSFRPFNKTRSKKKYKKILNELVSFLFLNNCVNCIIVTVLKRARTHARTHTHAHTDIKILSALVSLFFPCVFLLKRLCYFVHQEWRFRVIERFSPEVTSVVIE